MSDGEQRKLAAIMFTDMVGYSALAQRDETLAIELLEEQRRRLRSLFAQFNGVEVDCTGDGFWVEFASALEATRCRSRSGNPSPGAMLRRRTKSVSRSLSEFTWAMSSTAVAR